MRPRNEAAGDSLVFPLRLSCEDDGNEDGIENFSCWESPVGVLAGNGLAMLLYERRIDNSNSHTPAVSLR